MGRRRPVLAYASTYDRCGRRQDGGPSPLRKRHSVVTLLYLLRTVRSVPWSAPARTARQDITPSRSGSWPDRKSTRLNSSHVATSYAVFCLQKKNGEVEQVIRGPILLS